MRTIELDVRPFHERGEEPFEAIMAVVRELKESEQFLLVNSFEPKPLYAVMQRQGFEHTTVDMGNGEWRVLFKRQS
ncbi:MAG: DUF2249 domain-containing protein [Vulcanimicrobiaceae bacterium]